MPLVVRTMVLVTCWLLRLLSCADAGVLVEMRWLRVRLLSLRVRSGVVQCFKAAVLEAWWAMWALRNFGAGDR